MVETNKGRKAPDRAQDSGQAVEERRRVPSKKTARAMAEAKEIRRLFDRLDKAGDSKRE